MSKVLCSYSVKNLAYYHTHDDFCPDVATHIHDGFEIFCLVKGDVKYHIEGKWYKLNENDIVITNSKELHRIVVNPNLPYERLFLHVKPEFVSAFNVDDYNILGFIQNRKLGEFNKIDAYDANASGIHRHLSEIELHALKNLPESQILIKALIVQILVAINGIFSKNNVQIKNNIEYDKRIVKILEYINDNLQGKITLGELEKEFFISKYYLCELFRKNTGFSVLEYITYKRVLKAEELMCTGTSILEASTTVGFGDYSTFYKAFKKIMEISPKQYLKHKLE
jgi:AraC-like DNA-binding protein